MKLTKIKQGGSSESRRATLQELAFKYIFGERVPVLFTPGSFYHEGDICYSTDDRGIITLYLCTMSGFYDTLKVRGWIIATLRTDIQDILNKALSIDDYSHKVVYDTNVFIGKDIMINKTTAVLPTTPEPCCCIAVYADGKYLSQDLGDYTITDKTIKFNKVIVDCNTVTVYIKKPKNHNAKLFLYYDVTPSDMTTTTLTFDISGIESKFFTVCNLYYKGALISGSNYDVIVDNENEKIKIEMNTHLSVGANMEDFVLSTISSRNPYLVVERHATDYIVDDEVSSYRIEMENRINYEWTDTVFINGLNIPSNKVSINGNIASIKDERYYGEFGDTFTIVDDTYYYIDVPSIVSHEIVTEKNERTIPIPILNMDAYTDILLFKSSGVHISESRYFVDDGYIHLYPHDNSIAEGDRLVVQPMNYDKEVTIRHHITTVNNDLTVDVSQYINHDTPIDLLLFQLDGRYIGKNYYTVNNNVVKFKDGIVNPGDLIEAVYNYYEKEYTHTVTMSYSTNTSDNNIIRLRNIDYNTDKDTILLFNNTNGLFINPDNYTISDTGIITIKSGSGVLAGSSVDVIIVRDLKYIIYTESVDTVRNNLV